MHASVSGGAVKTYAAASPVASAATATPSTSSVISLVLVAPRDPADLTIDLLGSAGRLAGESLRHGKARAGVPDPRGLDRGVAGQQLRLSRDDRDHAGCPLDKTRPADRAPVRLRGLRPGGSSSRTSQTGDPTKPFRDEAANAAEERRSIAGSPSERRTSYERLRGSARQRVHPTSAGQMLSLLTAKQSQSRSASVAPQPDDASRISGLSR
jgi:hypothetical protein